MITKQSGIALQNHTWLVEVTAAGPWPPHTLVDGINATYEVPPSLKMANLEVITIPLGTSQLQAEEKNGHFSILQAGWTVEFSFALMDKFYNEIQASLARTDQFQVLIKCDRCDWPIIGKFDPLPMLVWRCLVCLLEVPRYYRSTSLLLQHSQSFVTLHCSRALRPIRQICLICPTIAATLSYDDDLGD